VKPLLTPEQMAQADKATIDAGTPAEVLMDRAGRAVARAAIDLMGGRYGKRALVVCGKGNNGGDGFVAARVLRGEGVGVDCLVLFDPDEAKGAPAHHLRLMREAGVEPIRFQPGWFLPHVYHVAIDAIFGTGFTGRIDSESDTGLAIELLRGHPALGAPVVAVDVPSGVDAGTGAVAGGFAAFARRTVTMAAMKTGLALPPGSVHAGRVTVADIGIPVPDVSTALVEPRDVKAWLPSRRQGDHKKSQGSVVVLAGSEQTRGAAILCARGALRMGCGYVTLVSTASVGAAASVVSPELLTRHVAGDVIGASVIDEIKDLLQGDVALAVGPGLGRGTEQSELVNRLLQEVDLPFVLDADALNALEGRIDRIADRKSKQVVLTPHPAELARLLGTDIHGVVGDRLGAAREAARRARCVVVAKGDRTVVASPRDARVIGPHAPALATAGTGDVLTGAIAARLASLLPDDSALPAATVGAFVHVVAGQAAAETHGAEGVVAMDVAEALPGAIERVRAGLPSSS
jgi:hydroxyethylthiazole kinase-like uncharacterized protein yjeF